MATGKIKQIIGAVVDIEFPVNELPDIYNAVQVKNHDGNVVVMESMQHLGNNVVRCVALSSTDGLQRGMEALDTGSPIRVPVGQATLSRMMDVIGQPIDGKGEIKADKTLPIHRPAPEFVDLQPSTEIWKPASRSLTCWRLIPKVVRLASSAALALAKRF